MVSRARKEHTTTSKLENSKTIHSFPTSLYDDWGVSNFLSLNLFLTAAFSSARSGDSLSITGFPSSSSSSQDHSASVAKRLNELQTINRRVEAAHLRSDVPVTSEEEKDDLIIFLQGEVNRLKEKLTAIINTAESTITSAQYMQEDMKAHYQAEIEVLKEKNDSLTEDNTKLRELLQKSNENLTAERDMLLRSVKYMERLRLRGRAESTNMDRKTLIRSLKALRSQSEVQDSKERFNGPQRVW